MSEKNNIEKRIAEIEAILQEIEGGEVALSEISKKYKTAVEKAKELENELSKIENEIIILSEDFSKEA